MNIRNVIAAGALLASCAASADSLEYLYWQVDLDSNNPWGVPDFSYATVRGSDSSDYLYFYDTSGTRLDTSLAVTDYKDVGDTGAVTPKGYSGTQSFATLAESYTFELWQENETGGDTLVGWATYGYSKLTDYISTAMGQTGAKALVVTAIPEPSGALLLLFGLAGLALRRRKAVAALAWAAALAVPFGAFASAGNLVYSFQPSADDTYADGTPALLGERYALVWLAEGSAGVDIAADGTVADASKGEIVQVRASSAQERGRILTFQVDEKAKDALAAKGGNWAVYLLDTRVYGADGGVTVAAVEDGKVATVNASKRLEKSVVEVAEASVESDTVKAETASATVATAVPSDAPQPEITGVEVVDGKVHVRVANTVPCLAYNLAGGSEAGSVSGKMADAPKTGVAGKEIELVAPATSSCGFFKVNRN